MGSVGRCLWRADEREHRRWVQLPVRLSGKLTIRLRSSRFSLARSVPDSSTDSTPRRALTSALGTATAMTPTVRVPAATAQANPSAPDSNPGGGTGNRGVYGPQAELPGDPGAPLGDRGKDDGNAKIETERRQQLHPHRAGGWQASERRRKPVARSDYYRGDKGNDFNTDGTRAAAEGQSKTPGNKTRQPPAPLQARPMHLSRAEFVAAVPDASSGIPGD